VNPPRGCTAVQWVIHTSEEVDTFEDAWRILEYYETRWAVEVYQPEYASSARLYQLAA
jgi:hypothetical protein